MPTEYPENDSRTTPFEGPASDDAVRRAPESKTRYVDVPPLPEHAAAQRNLAWGVVLLLCGFCALWFALMIPGHNAARTLIASLGTFGLIALFYNLRILRQRNGIFLALATVILFGAAMPLVERGFSGLDRLARERLGDEEKPNKIDVAPPPPPPPTTGNVPAAPVAPEAPPPNEDSERVAKKSSEDDIVRELVATPPPATATKVIEVTEDVEVKIKGRPFIVKKGDKFEFVGMADGMTTFKSGDQTISISSDFAVLKINFDERYASAQKEAMRLYPGLAEKFSEQNEKFVEASRELKETLPDFFKSPEWPLRLAEQLAAANGWKSTKQLEEEAAAANAEPPAESEPPENSEPPAEPAPTPAVLPKTSNAPNLPKTSGGPRLPKLPDVPQENPLPPIPDGKR